MRRHPRVDGARVAGHATDRPPGVDDVLEGPRRLGLRAPPFRVAREYGPDPAGIGPPAADMPVFTSPAGQPERPMLDRHQQAGPAVELAGAAGPVMNGPERPPRKTDEPGIEVNGATRGEWPPRDGAGPAAHGGLRHELKVLDPAARRAGAGSGDAGARDHRGEGKRARRRAQKSAHDAPCY